MLTAFPTVNRNGTHKDALVQANCDAAQAVRDALEALTKASPNGRDYQADWRVGGSATLTKAIEEHRGRATRLQTVLDELMELAENIASQEI